MTVVSGGWLGAAALAFFVVSAAYLGKVAACEIVRHARWRWPSAWERLGRTARLLCALLASFGAAVLMALGLWSLIAWWALR